MNLTLWNDNIWLLEAGLYYALENAWWSSFKGETQLSLGNYFELEPISETDFINSTINPNQPTIEQSTKTGEDISLSLNEAILRELEIIKSLVEPLFKKMVDEQLEDSNKWSL